MPSTSYQPYPLNYLPLIQAQRLLLFEHRHKLDIYLHVKNQRSEQNHIRVHPLAVTQALPTNRLTFILIGLVVALIALLLQERQELYGRSATLDRLQHLQTSNPAKPTIHQEELICRNPHLTPAQTFLAPLERSMSLADSATKVASTFEYGKTDINTGVKEFLKQMGAQSDPYSQNP